jgi:diguanylate cyclase (GGDEF)-like protein
MLHLVESRTPDAEGLLRYDAGTGAGPLSRLLRSRALVSHFQPIVDLQDGSIFAHEALVRGPREMPLRSPDALFAAAKRENLTQDFEVACMVLAIERWAALRQPGRVFVNISASALVRCFAGQASARIAACIARDDLQASQVTFEITEHERVDDVPLLVAVANEVHQAGMRLALDDFGDGRSSLRLWSELSPDIVKIDKYFTREISQRAESLKTLRALMQIADSFGTTLVAEGIETADDLRVLRDLGVSLGQGYFLGRPAALPVDGPDAAAQGVLRSSIVSVMPVQRVVSSPGRLKRAHVFESPAAPLKITNDEVAARFESDPSLHAIALVDDERPVALIARQVFLDQYTRRYFKEIFGRRECLPFANSAPVLIDVNAEVSELAQVLTSADQRYLSEGFIYTDNGRYRGVGLGHQLVRRVTESRIEAARHANPLTLLPGNIPITEQIDRLLEAGASFTACYADLSNFKPYNDYHGYWRGDEMIKLVAETIQAHANSRCDFVGHVGGDDFVVLFQSEDWEKRCQQAIEAFAARAVQLYDGEARAAGGIHAEDRHGVTRFFGFTSLYMGAVQVTGRSGGLSASDVASRAARAKQSAKTRVISLHVDTISA